VTIGERVGSQVEKIFGTVTGTGTLDGKQVLFLDGKDTPYDIADILAVGSIPEKLAGSEAAEYQDAWRQADTGASGSTENGERDPHTPDENGALG